VVHDDGNGGNVRAHLRLERRDWLKAGLAIFGAVATALGIAAALAMYVFMPRTEGITVHAAIRQEIAVDKAVTAAVAKEKQKAKTVREDSIDSNLEQLQAQSKVTDENVRRLMWDADVKPAKKVAP